ncbi:MAG: response regulator [Candidatus Niyogibacteria bacterium]|nr:MAG: response regulator [Candidatus Niyogibacteria bacterium]
MNKVLIVEDEEFLVRVLKDNLETENFSADVAMDGDSAIERIRTNRPDIVLLDLLLPKRDGFSVLEEIKKDPALKTIPVIVLSNLGGDADIKKALSLGAENYFVKSQHPIEEVIDMVKAYLGGQRSSSAQ